MWQPISCSRPHFKVERSSLGAVCLAYCAETAKGRVVAETGNQAKGGRPSVNGITVVIPCLNEEESIGLVVDAAKQGIARAGLPGEVLVVDNAS